MKIITLNAKGLRDCAKRRRIRSLIQSSNFDVCVLQESKYSSLDSISIYGLWGNEEIEWVVKDADSLYGGMVTMWKAGIFSLEFHFSGEGFIGICVDVGCAGRPLYIVDIYAAYSMDKKKKEDVG